MKQALYRFFCCLTVFCLLFAGLPCHAGAELSLPSAEERATYPEEACILLNQLRAEHGLAPVKLAPILVEAAGIRAEELSHSYQHVRPNREDWFTIVGEMGLDTNCYAAENIAAGYSTPEEVITAWTNSSSHCAAMLGENYEYVGIQICVREKDPSYYYTYWEMLLISSAEPLEGAYVPGQVSILDNALLIGDCDCDGSRDLNDAVLLHHVLLGQVTPTEQQIQQMDCYADGIIDQKDASILMQFLLELIPELPVSG